MEGREERPRLCPAGRRPPVSRWTPPRACPGAGRLAGPWGQGSKLPGPTHSRGLQGGKPHRQQHRGVQNVSFEPSLSPQLARMSASPPSWAVPSSLCRRDSFRGRRRPHCWPGRLGVGSEYWPCLSWCSRRRPPVDQACSRAAARLTSQPPCAGSSGPRRSGRWYPSGHTCPPGRPGAAARLRALGTDEDPVRLHCPDILAAAARSPGSSQRWSLWPFPESPAPGAEASGGARAWVGGVGADSPWQRRVYSGRFRRAVCATSKSRLPRQYMNVGRKSAAMLQEPRAQVGTSPRAKTAKAPRPPQSPAPGPTGQEEWEAWPRAPGGPWWRVTPAHLGLLWMERRARLKARLRQDSSAELISRCRLVCGGGGGVSRATLPPRGPRFLGLQPPPHPRHP